MNEESMDRAERDEIFRYIRNSITDDEDAAEEVVFQELLESKGVNTRKIRLEKKHDLLGCIAILVSAIVGSAILIEPQLALQSVGSLSTTLILWAVYGVVATFGALTYAEIGTMFPVSGGDYSYLLIFYGEFVGYLYQVGANFVTVPSFKAIMGIQCAKYALSFSTRMNFTESGNPALEKDLGSAVICLAVAFIVLATFLCTVTTLYNHTIIPGLVCKCLTLVFALGMCFEPWALTGIAALQDLEQIHLSPEITECTEGNTVIDIALELKSPRSKLLALAQAIYQAAFAFHGWNTLNSIVDEIKDPLRNLPRAVMIALPSITVCYLAMHFSYAVVFTRDQLLSLTNVANAFTDNMVMNKTSLVIAVLFLLCIFLVLLTYVNSSSRIAVVGSRNSHFPKIFSLLHIQHLSPVPSLWFTSGLSVIYVLLAVRIKGGVGSFLGIAMYNEMVFSCLVVGGHIFYRIKEPYAKTPTFKPCIGIPIIYFLFTSLLVLVPFISFDWRFRQSFVCGWRNQLTLLTGLLFTFIIAIPSYFCLVWRQWKGNFWERILVRAENCLVRFLQRLFLLAKEDSEGERDEQFQ